MIVNQIGDAFFFYPPLGMGIIVYSYWLVARRYHQIGKIESIFYLSVWAVSSFIMQMGTYNTLLPFTCNFNTGCI